jgi:dimethylargininase
MRQIAITRRPGPAIADCALTHIERQPIDVALAVRQHGRYEEALAELGFVVVSLPPSDDLPDASFVEDTAVVLGDEALICRPGEMTRQRETGDIAKLLEERVRVDVVEAPATIDGGDVLVAGKRVFVGISTRTNAHGAERLRLFAERLGYTVTKVNVRGSLHLKTAVTALTDGVLLINREWIDASPFDGFELVDVDPEEAFGANVLRRNDAILYPEEFARTIDRIAPHVGSILTLPFSELLKAEAGLTCCSLLVERG